MPLTVECPHFPSASYGLATVRRLFIYAGRMLYYGSWLAGEMLSASLILTESTRRNKSPDVNVAAERRATFSQRLLLYYMLL